ncbi:Retrovirus-related Pol polyprotein from transposon TNT 1-94 [Eumeta japonica]|uniref:Retrovirus-related Pol polyprotein from transposon TNT 1-94 n=1 Tax=Eumeta variegata TaxID=151549 RepID=A0A4C1XJN4_EUMVA|nr:Retrovirus-related Pol polyprotein from transposon TNT 1-94 [Eumeta japonica]
MTTAHKLRNIGFKVDDEWLGTLLLAGLPDEYKPMIMAIESSGVAITTDSIKTKLLQEVKNRDPSVFFVNKSKNNKQLFKQNKQTKGPRCYSCNNYGHIAKHCKVKNNKKQTDNSFVAVFSATNNNNSGWYVDSGAAMHMTMNKDWIYDETPPPIKTIRVANDKELRVESCGKVNIHVKSKNGSTNSIQRLGHLNYNDMKKLKDHTDGVTMPQNSELTCVPCIKGKQARSPFPCEGSRANQLLEIIHSDICGPMETPEEVWSGRKPDLSHMRIFGCEAMMHIPKEKLKKWDSKSCKMIFVGYCEDSKGYRLLDPKTKTVTKSRDVVFLENSIKTDTVPVTLSDTKKQQQVSRNSLSERSDCSTDISTHTAVESDDGDEEYVPEQSIGTPPTSNITLRPHNRPNPKVEPKSYLCMANVPQTYEDALSSEDSELWIKSIKEELKAHEDNGTWELVKKPDNVRLLDCKWVFRVKNEESSPRYKARLCAKGFAQKSGIDYTETFSPTVRYDSIRLLLSIAAEKRMTIMQFDIKTAFLYGKLEEEIYMKPPEGLDVENSMACRLIKSLYGLKQAPRCWNVKFNSVLNKYGFFNSHADKCVYVSSNREAQVYLLLYVDDGLLCSTSPTIITEVLNHLQKEFNVKICKTSNFIGIQIEQCKDYIFIHQRKYIEELLSKFDLDNANPNSIPADPHVTLQKSTVLENKKCFPYREAVGSLMFAAIVTRPDIMFAVSTVSRFLNSHDQSHWNAVKKIFKYLKGTLSFGLCFRSNENNTLESYSDADYANDPVTRRSTTGYVFMNKWSSRDMEQSTTNNRCAVYHRGRVHGVLLCHKEALWIRQLLALVVAVHAANTALIRAAVFKLGHQNSQLDDRGCDCASQIRSLFTR